MSSSHSSATTEITDSSGPINSTRRKRNVLAINTSKIGSIMRSTRHRPKSSWVPPKRDIETTAGGEIKRQRRDIRKSLTTHGKVSIVITTIFIITKAVTTLAWSSVRSTAAVTTSRYGTYEPQILRRT